MPEAAVDKDDLPKSGKDKIRFARKVFTMKSEPIAHPVNNPPDRQLRQSIHRTDSAHILRASGFREFVHLVWLHEGPKCRAVHPLQGSAPVLFGGI